MSTHNLRLSLTALLAVALLTSQTGLKASAHATRSASRLHHTFALAPSTTFRVPGSRSSNALARVPRLAGHSGAFDGTSRPSFKTISDRSQLELPGSAYPADFSIMETGPISATDADNIILSQLHRQSYEGLGMLGGWFTYYAKDLGDGSFDDVYQGSYYRDASAASSAYNDVLGVLSASGFGTTCSFGDSCYEAPLRIHFSDGDYQALTRFVRQGNALDEQSVAVPMADYAQQQAAMRADADRVTNAFVNEAQPPSPTTTATASPVPTATATSTPTATATPTATSTATATSVPQKTVKSCKRGYKRIHGKCKKTKKKV
jgi:hypothetical protein